MPDVSRNYPSCRPMRITREIADRADTIFVMESYMKTRIVRDYEQSPDRICSLNIPDWYNRDDPELVSWIKEKLGSLVFCG